MNEKEKLQAKAWLYKIDALATQLYNLSNKECRCIEKIELLQEIKKRIVSLKELILK